LSGEATRLSPSTREANNRCGLYCAVCCRQSGAASGNFLLLCFSSFPCLTIHCRPGRSTRHSFTHLLLMLHVGVTQSHRLGGLIPCAARFICSHGGACCFQMTVRWICTYPVFCYYYHHDHDHYHHDYGCASLWLVFGRLFISLMLCTVSGGTRYLSI
jgi:hypothetical protein